MKFEVLSKVPKTNCLIVGVYEESKIINDYSKQLPENIIKFINARIKDKEFEGKEETTLTTYLDETADKLILIGLGEKIGKKTDKKESDLLRRLGASVNLLTQKYKELSIVLPTGSNDTEDFSRFIEGFLLGSYKFEKYISKKEDKVLTNKINLIGVDKKITKQLKEIEALTESIFFTRDIINIPGSDMSPNIIEKECKKLEKFKNIKVKVLNHAALTKMKAGAITAVGQGAKEKARMIVFEYKKNPKNKKPLAFVGKGVSFDTGGLNLKPTRYIEDMKLDMSGAATVMGIFKTLAKLQPNLHVIGVVGVVENALSRDAYKPGDVIKALNGKTIEVLNTDAEGRLVLADCLTYAEKQFKPSHIIDFATLTGAALYTVGHDMTPILGNNKELIDKLLEIGKQTDEFMWQLPLYDKYNASLKGVISDLNNTGDSVKAGTITATLFLQNFINNNTPWVHCDIAGTAYGDKPENSYKPKGARGVLIRSMWKFIKTYK